MLHVNEQYFYLTESTMKIRFLTKTIEMCDMASVILRNTLKYLKIHAFTVSKSIIYVKECFYVFLYPENTSTR